MSLLDQLSRLFVEPQPTVAAPERDVRWLPPGERAGPAPRSPQHIAVVCSPRDARVAGGAAALALAHAGRTVAAAALEWNGEDSGILADRAASPAARRCAARLRGADHAATAAGRVVRVVLPGGEDAAAAAARSAIVRAGCPTALVVAAARGPEVERLLAEQELILLAVRHGTDEDLAAVALAALERLAPSAVVELRSSPGAAALARTGVALAAPLRAPFLSALR